MSGPTPIPRCFSIGSGVYSQDREWAAAPPSPGERSRLSHSIFDRGGNAGSAVTTPPLFCFVFFLVLKDAR